MTGIITDDVRETLKNLFVALDEDSVNYVLDCLGSEEEQTKDVSIQCQNY